jgi:Flp pilus assembly protein TadD
MTRLFRNSALLALVACALSFPVAAQIPSNDIGAGIGRRGRYIISGTLREAEGERPLENVQVQLWTLTAGMAAVTFTSSNGNFAFSNVPQNTYYLVVEQDGYARIREEVNFSNRPPVGIQLVLKREAAFTGERVGSGLTVSARELSIPRRAREAMARGLTLLNEKSDYKGSLAQFQRAVREYPQYYEAYLQMGLAYMRLGDAARFEETLRTSVDLSQRQYPEALVRLASFYSTEKRFADAEPLARDAVKLEPDSCEANQELARALHGLDRSAEAEASALEAARIEPDNPPTYLILANIHLKLRKFPDLIRDLDNFLQLAPNAPEADQARRMREQVFQRMANIQPRTP